VNNPIVYADSVIINFFNIANCYLELYLGWQWTKAIFNIKNIVVALPILSLNIIYTV
jgi:hypothetical protein